MSDNIIIIGVFVIYMALMIGIGAFFFKKNTGISDYVLGGRSLNPWVAALSAQASDMSGWLLMGLPGLAYVFFAGTSEAIWTAIGLAIGTYLNWLIVAKRLRQYTKISGDAVTLPEFFANRFHDETGVFKNILKIVSAVFILVFFLFYTASMFQASAKLFNSVFGLNYHIALIISVGIIVAYTFLGGFLAVCWTDTIQGLLIFAALVIAPIVAVVKAGGFDGLASAVETITTEVGAEFSLMPLNGDGSINVLLLISALAWGLGYFGQPHILPRFMAIRTPKEIRPARIIAVVWVLVSLGMAIVVGIVGRVLYPGLADSETVFIRMVQDLFPAVLTGVFLTAILAAIMSSADSQLLVTSSAVSNDICGLLTKKMDEKKRDKTLMWIGRITVVVVSIIAALLVSVENPTEGTIIYKINESVFKLVSFAWAGFGASFGPIVLFALFWKRTTIFGAIAGIISGGLTACIWWLLEGGIFDVYEIVPGFIISGIVIVVVSLLTKPNAETLEEFDKVKSVEI
ncbi:MAG: sodium/proline symporter PutP [Lachnospiraceae bacterium]|nr:sodium/proline symporter PutP [Lachnospiraceae bacterium]